MDTPTVKDAIEAVLPFYQKMLDFKNEAEDNKAAGARMMAELIEPLSDEEVVTRLNQFQNLKVSVEQVTMLLSIHLLRRRANRAKSNS
jgi:hypothetical protein